eukprot:TRINITY_DN102406_c0_g1_i1.p1 TRINITY_DN102406_c0_g1~~TRINITY_DN102406_c0_g1_i1.p1  ORF type:complete len:138 (+),score=28.66 TRINITY_DN102406_c0_g1_i1:54-416(+)
MAVERARSRSPRAAAASAPPPPAIVPKKCVLLKYSYVADILEKRAPHRAAHLAHWKAYADAKQVLLGGATDPPEAAFLVFYGLERATIEKLVKEDPYVVNGLVPDWQLLDWNVVLGSAMP